jgi:hypothetical protein
MGATVRGMKSAAGVVEREMVLSAAGCGCWRAVGSAAERDVVRGGNWAIAGGGEEIGDTGDSGLVVIAGGGGGCCFCCCDFCGDFCGGAGRAPSKLNGRRESSSEGGESRD